MATEITASSGDISNQEIDAIIVNLFEGVTAPAGATGVVDSKLNGAISELIAGSDLSGKYLDVSALYPRDQIPARRVLIVGLGKQEKFTLDRARRAAAAAIEKAHALGAQSAATIVHGAGIGGLDPEAAARAVAEGTALGLYTYDVHKSSTPERKAMEQVRIVEFYETKGAAVSRGVEQGAKIAECANFARDLVNSPPNECTPTYLAAKAEQIAAAFGGNVNIIEMPEMRELGMGALLSVTEGSDEPAKFIIFEHNPTALEEAPIIFVGKAVTFDTGGYSLKPSQSMAEMKTDMGGGAAVLGAMRAAATLNIQRRVIGIIPAVENMVSGRASRPSDVVKASNGKTIEIISTDAEGRMILADALIYAARYNPAAVIDLATLTGAAMIALGRGGAAALFSTQDDLSARLLQASSQSGERVWQLPLYEEYTEWMRRSEVADLLNSPNDRYAGTGTSAAFLQEFASEYPWAHLDIAPMAYLPKGTPVRRMGAAGATGYGVRLLAYYLLGNS